MFEYKDISELNRRIVIQSATITRDAHGGQIETWATLRMCWAKVEQVGTSEINEKMDAKRLSSINMTDFVIKYWSGTITPKMRVSYNSKYYDIEAVVEMGDRDFILLKTRIIE